MTDRSSGLIGELQPYGGLTGEVEKFVGRDGYSPKVSLQKEEGVTTLCVEDASGMHTAQILDGLPGKDGDKGDQGIPGKPGRDGVGIGRPGTGENAEAFNDLANEASGVNSHAEGHGTIASGGDSHAEGHETVASGSNSHAEGYSTVASGGDAHAEGDRTEATANFAHAEGSQTTAIEMMAHAEGDRTSAWGYASHAEGERTFAPAPCSHAEGLRTTAKGAHSHAEGEESDARGINSHAEGYKTVAEDGEPNTGGAHAEGYECRASNRGAHAEGKGTVASGYAAHAQGQDTVAGASYSHAEGYLSRAEGYCSHAEGVHTLAKKPWQHVQGKYNLEDTAPGNGKYAHIVGNGTDDTHRSNAHTVDWDGNGWFAGDVLATDRSTGTSHSVVGIAGDVQALSGRMLSGNHVFSVKNYGAVGDGVTEDDAAIQAALDACHLAGGGIVYFPSGIYLISASIKFYSNQHLLGDPGAVLLQKDGNVGDVNAGNIMRNYNNGGGGYTVTSNVVIEGLTFDGGTQEETATALLVFCHSQNITVTGCTFTRGYSNSDVGNAHDIEVNSSKNVTIRFCTFVGNRRTNLSSELIQLDAFYMQGAYPWLPDEGENQNVDYTEFENVLIANCYFEGVIARNDGNTIIGNHGNYGGRNVRIQGCYAKGANYFFRPAHIDSAILVNNIAENCGILCGLRSGSPTTAYLMGNAIFKPEYSTNKACYLVNGGTAMGQVGNVVNWNPETELPAVTEADNGKVLTVVDGAWALSQGEAIEGGDIEGGDIDG